MCALASTFTLACCTGAPLGSGQAGGWRGALSGWSRSAPAAASGPAQDPSEAADVLRVSLMGLYIIKCPPRPMACISVPKVQPLQCLASPGIHVSCQCPALKLDGADAGGLGSLCSGSIHQGSAVPPAGSLCAAVWEWGVRTCGTHRVNSTGARPCIGPSLDLPAKLCSCCQEQVLPACARLGASW